MNRIILIGNGFDLGHELKTSYKNFIDHIKETYFQAFIKRDQQAIENNTFFSFPTGYTTDITQYNKRKGKMITNFDGLRSMYYSDNFGNSGYVGIQFRNKFLEFIFDHCNNEGWNGFEYEFNRVLISLLDSNKSEKIIRGYSIEQLNQDFQDIIDELEKYLTLTESNSTAKIKDNILKAIYTKPISRVPIELNKINLPNNILFLNFNYTATPELYLYYKLETLERAKLHDQNYFDNSLISTEIIYIHGKLNDTSNKIIFGYGDELDDNQKLIEQHNPEYLRYIKSILYTQNDNYTKLLDFLDAEQFDVIILGHSCSNSDRTLLNTIFEHENNVSIQPALRNENFDIYINIYKNFIDKKKMRSRVVDKIRTVKI